ncbi:MAG: hypothetical protein ACJATI_004349 [Halioglobus sp.]|jgi:hypothetical protein
MNLKGMIDAVMQSDQGTINISETIDDLERSLKSYKDNKENKIFLFGSGALVIIFALILMYIGEASWPLMFIVVWIGGFMYYRVNEKGLELDTLQKKSLINQLSPIPKMDYLISGIDLKIGRKEVLKGYLSLMLSSAAMMAHHLFVDSSVTINMFLLIGAIIASYFFWNNFYKDDISELSRIKEQIQELKNQLILGRVYD